MADFTTRDKVTLLKDFLNVVGTETEGVEVKITRDADQGMRWYVDPEVLIDVKNDSGAQIDKGTPVYVSGTHGGSGKPTINKAQADDAATMPAIGLTLTDLADEAEGYVVAAGTLRNLDTDTPGWDAGDPLYVSPTTAGGLQTTRPTGDTQLVQKVALVTRRHATAGSVIVMGAGRTNDTPNDSYSGRYDTEAETARSDASTTTEIYYTARPDGDGYAESAVDDTGETNTINRTLFFSDKFEADPDTSGDWTQYTTQPAPNATFATAKAALLAGLSDTDGTANTRGTLPVSLKMERTVTVPFLLDTYTGAHMAYSVRKLRSAYTGDCMRVREDSGNTEADIGFDSNGDLDTAAIASHCGSANGYVVKWYDQSGNSADLFRLTTTGQPQIYNGSAVLTDNGRPILTATSNDHEFTTGTLTGMSFGSDVYAFSVMKRAAARCIWLQGITTTANFFLVAESSNTSSYYNGVSSHTLWQDGASWTPSNRGDVWTDTATQSLITVDANLSTWGSGLRVGGFGFFQRMYDMQELVIYNSDKGSDRAAIESAINVEFGIY